jgi:hypothetical protein
MYITAGHLQSYETQTIPKSKFAFSFQLNSPKSVSPNFIIIYPSVLLYSPQISRSVYTEPHRYYSIRDILRIDTYRTDNHIVADMDIVKNRAVHSDE